MSSKEIIFAPMFGSPVDACRSCGALVEASVDTRAVHRRWHERIEAVLASVEHADELAAELRERGDG